MVLLKTVEEDHDLEISWKTGAAAQISQIFYLFIYFYLMLSMDSLKSQQDSGNAFS